jgi:hypothetical protein
MYKNWWIDASLMVVFVIMAGVLVSYFYTLAPKGRWYDCSISEISPDFPPELKQECRKLRSEANKNGRI